MTQLQVDAEIMFDMFYKIQELIEFDTIVEISIKQHHITIQLKSPNMLYFSDVLSLSHDTLVTPQSSYVTNDNDIIYLMIEDIPDDIETITSDFKIFVQVIRFLAENICQCPSLEYVISGQYIKFFLDKPGFKLEDLKKVEDLFGMECTLELAGPRPYILFINEKLF